METPKLDTVLTCDGTLIAKKLEYLRLTFITTVINVAVLEGYQEGKARSSVCGT